MYESPSFEKNTIEEYDFQMKQVPRNTLQKYFYRFLFV